MSLASSSGRWLFQFATSELRSRKSSVASGRLTSIRRSIVDDVPPMERANSWSTSQNHCTRQCRRRDTFGEPVRMHDVRVFFHGRNGGKGPRARSSVHAPALADR